MKQTKAQKATREAAENDGRDPAQAEAQRAAVAVAVGGRLGARLVVITAEPIEPVLPGDPVGCWSLGLWDPTTETPGWAIQDASGAVTAWDLA